MLFPASDILLQLEFDSIFVTDIFIKLFSPPHAILNLLFRICLTLKEVTIFCFKFFSFYLMTDMPWLNHLKIWMLCMMQYKCVRKKGLNLLTNIYFFLDFMWFWFSNLGQLIILQNWGGFLLKMALYHGPKFINCFYLAIDFFFFLSFKRLDVSKTIFCLTLLCSMVSSMYFCMLRKLATKYLKVWRNCLFLCIVLCNF